MSDQPKFDAIDDGPLALSGNVTFTNSDGSVADPQETRYLCRCGQSANKPYCDGTHKDTGFSSDNPAGGHRDKLIAYESEDITVHYSPYLCSHAGECNKRLSAVFDAKKKPWIQPEHGSVDDIMDVVKACPSGAIQASFKGGAPEHRAGETPAVVVEKNGPLRVEAVTLNGGNFSDNASPEKYVLCRCGQSKNKPFCDGSHSAAGWKE